VKPTLSFVGCVVRERHPLGSRKLDAVFDELTRKGAHHYRQMIGLYVSGTRRVRRVIVGCSTAPPAQTIAYCLMVAVTLRARAALTTFKTLKTGNRSGDGQ
jgi:hypothetical protein